MNSGGEVFRGAERREGEELGVPWRSRVGRVEGEVGDETGD